MHLYYWSCVIYFVFVNYEDVMLSSEIKLLYYIYPSCELFGTICPDCAGKKYMNRMGISICLLHFNFLVADVFTWRQQNQTATKNNWPLIKHRRPGWRHLATGGIIGQASATILSATGTSAIGFCHRWLVLLSVTGALIISDWRNRSLMVQSAVVLLDILIAN